MPASLGMSKPLVNQLFTNILPRPPITFRDLAVLFSDLSFLMRQSDTRLSVTFLTNRPIGSQSKTVQLVTLNRRQSSIRIPASALYTSFTCRPVSVQSAH